MDRSFWLLKAVKFCVAAAFFVTVATFATMYLWNWLVPGLFHGPFLSFSQALGLLVLSRIFTGGFWRGGNGFAQGRAWKRRIEQRMATLSPDEREQFRQQMRSRCAAPWSSKPVASEEVAR